MGLPLESHEIPASDSAVRDVQASIERSLQAESDDLRSRIAYHRIWVLRVFLPPGLYFSLRFLLKESTAPMGLRLMIGISSVLIAIYYLTALKLWRGSSISGLAARSPYNAQTNIFIDVAFMTLFVLPILWVSRQNGAQAPYTIISMLLSLPVLAYSFELKPGGPRYLGCLVSSTALGIVHLTVPSSFPPTMAYAGAVQYLCVVAMYFFIFFFGEIYAQRIRRLVTLAATREIWRDRLARFLPPRAVERLESENGIQMGGETCRAAVLFVDIRKFTQMAASMETRAVLDMLNEYFSRMVRVVFQHNGTVDKFLGDGLLAVFIESDDHPNPAGDALECAMAMQREVHELSAERLARGESPLRVGIGIHYGPVIAGWVGSERKPEYTVIGDTVNLAARVQDLTKRLGFEILATRQALETMLPRAAIQPLGRHRMRGREEPIDVFAIESVTPFSKVKPYIPREPQVGPSTDTFPAPKRT